MATKETYNQMQLTELKALAKERKLKGVSGVRKSQLIDILLQFDESNGAVSRETNKEEKKSEEKKPAARRTRGADKNSSSKKENSERRPRASQNREQSEKHTENRGRHTRSGNDNRRQSLNNRKNSRLQRSDEEVAAAEVTEAAVSTETSPKEAAREAAREQADIPRYKDAHPCKGMLEVLPDGFGFLRGNGYTTDENDVYVSPSQIRRFRLRTGDMLTGETRKNNPTDKYGALLFMDSVNGKNPDINAKRTPFEKLTPIFPNERIRLEREGGSAAARIVDLVSPIGKGQRGMIVSQPKAGKTTLLKEVALSVMHNNPEIHLIILLIDERPEEVTDMKETIAKANQDGSADVEVVASTFDETPENHKRISEMVIEHARRMVEDKKDVMILLDSITRLARAYNLTVPPSGRTLSGGLDPTALYMPKRFFGAARNMREGGSLTILATALVETGSRMDDVVFEEFKGTGNMELVLDRSLSERRVFPAIDLARSSTRRDDMLLTREEIVAMNIIRKGLSGMKSEEATETVLNLISRTKTNYEFCREIVRMRVI
ncbi:MAG: transcription termination factor Rho [Candidatus Weimeria sp.]